MSANKSPIKTPNHKIFNFNPPNAADLDENDDIFNKVEVDEVSSNTTSHLSKVSDPDLVIQKPV